MRMIYKGYAITTYGKSKLSVTDKEGREVYHTDNRGECEMSDYEKMIDNLIRQKEGKK